MHYYSSGKCAAEQTKVRDHAEFRQGAGWSLGTMARNEKGETFISRTACAVLPFPPSPVAPI